jgi:general secretion pathway protein D
MMADKTLFDPASMLRSFAVAMTALVLVAGCGTLAERVDEPVATPTLERESTRAPDGEINLYGDDEDEDADGLFEETEYFVGTGVFIDESASRPRADPPDDDGEITLNFEGQGIQEVVHAILGHMFQENYVIAPGVSGEVTFSTARPLQRDQIMPVLEMLLRWNNATLIWREGRYHVVPISEAVRGNLVPRTDALERGRGYEVLAVPLQYIAPAKMAELLEPYAREDGVFNVDNARSLLFLAGTRHELRNYMQIIETFDVDWLAGMSIGIFDLRRIEVDELVPELETVFGEGGETPLAGMFRFLPIERLNAVMVITPNEHYLKEAEKWIRRLDRSGAEAGARLYVYRVKNLEADVLAGYLGDLFGTGGARQPRDRERRGGLAPGLEPAQVSSVGDFQRQQDTTRQDGQARTTQGGMTLGEDGDVRITAVQETNSLLIQASPSKYDAILNAIERLDEEPLQVMIEAQVIEVTLNDSLRYGVNWFLSNAQPGSSDFPGMSEDFSQSRAQDSLSMRSSNIFGTVTRRGMDRTFVTATLEMLESMTDTRTLSSPTLLVRNNSEANINVGSQVPVQSTSFTGGTTDRLIGSFQYINTGVILSVTPRVNPGGLVYLRVDQEVSSPTGLGSDRNPTVDTRRVSTDVAVQSGQTVILGGMIQETREANSAGVPGLSRLPGIGGLFGRRDRTVNRNETLVLITPTVLESTSRLEEVSRDVQRNFRAMEPIKSN